MFIKNLEHIKFYKFRNILGLKFYSPKNTQTFADALNKGKC